MSPNIVRTLVSHVPRCDIMMNLLVLCIQHTPIAAVGTGGRRGRGGGQPLAAMTIWSAFSAISPISAIIGGVIAAALILPYQFFLSYLFKWGNSTTIKPAKFTFRQRVMKAAQCLRSTPHLLFLALCPRRVVDKVYSRQRSDSLRRHSALMFEMAAGSTTKGVTLQRSPSTLLQADTSHRQIVGMAARTIGHMLRLILFLAGAARSCAMMQRRDGRGGGGEGGDCCRCQPESETGTSLHGSFTPATPATAHAPAAPFSITSVPAATSPNPNGSKPRRALSLQKCRRFLSCRPPTSTAIPTATSSSLMLRTRLSRAAPAQFTSHSFASAAEALRLSSSMSRLRSTEVHSTFSLKRSLDKLYSRPTTKAARNNSIAWMGIMKGAKLQATLQKYQRRSPRMIALRKAIAWLIAIGTYLLALVLVIVYSRTFEVILSLAYVTHRRVTSSRISSFRQKMFLLTPLAFHFAQVIDQATAMFGFFAAIVVSSLVIEPVNVVFLSALPALVNEESRSGRFVQNLRWTYLEFFSP